MYHHHCIEALDCRLKDITQNTRSLGGKEVLICKNFLQILPVIQSGSKAQIVRVCTKSSFLYHSFQNVQPTENMTLLSLLQHSTASEEVVKPPRSLLQVGEGKV